MDSKEYVNVVQMSILLKAMRNSPALQRAITYTEFDRCGPKTILKMLLKYNDY